MPDTVVTRHENNFETLKKAFADGNIALVECQEVGSGDIVAVICAVMPDYNAPDGQEFEFVPFAQMFKENPYDEWRPPNPDGGYFPTNERK